jgi:hypothetical protein
MSMALHQRESYQCGRGGATQTLSIEEEDRVGRGCKHARPERHAHLVVARCQHQEALVVSCMDVGRQRVCVAKLRIVIAIVCNAPSPTAPIELSKVTTNCSSLPGLSNRDAGENVTLRVGVRVRVVV